MAIIAILTSDWHLSHKCPTARSAEPNWYDAQERVVRQVIDLAEKHKCPIIIAGDIFDKFNNPPELLNWCYKTIRYKRGIWTIAGQHDIEHHNLENIHKTSYQTLVNLCVIHDIGFSSPIIQNYLVGWGFNWGEDLQCWPLVKSTKGINLAVIHKYMWSTTSTKHPMAIDETNINSYLPQLNGYDAAVIGDNHIGFQFKFGNGQHGINCGTLIRRKANEIPYHPTIGLLHEDGRINPYSLDITDDKFTEEALAKQEEITALSMNDFIQEFKNIAQHTLDYTEALQQFIAARKSKLMPNARRIILDSIKDD